jgi:dTMP kinase
MERRLALFITFEGGEGAGKSTQANLLVERLRAVGETVVALREPGGTPLGDYLRDWLKASDRPLTAEAELLLFVAARAELVRSLIIPALAAEQAVVLDRYADSTTAYQGYGRGLPLRQVASANALATGGLSPGLTVLLDAPPEATLQRALSRTGEDGERRFEDEAAAFHRRVRAGFLRLAKRSPERWLVLDAMESEATIHARVWKRVQRVRGN